MIDNNFNGNKKEERKKAALCHMNSFVRQPKKKMRCEKWFIAILGAFIPLFFFFYSHSFVLPSVKQHNKNSKIIDINIFLWMLMGFFFSAMVFYSVR